MAFIFNGKTYNSNFSLKTAPSSKISNATRSKTKLLSLLAFSSNGLADSEISSFLSNTLSSASSFVFSIGFGLVFSFKSFWHSFNVVLESIPFEVNSVTLFIFSFVCLSEFLKISGKSFSVLFPVASFFLFSLDLKSFSFCSFLSIFNFSNNGCKDL